MTLPRTLPARLDIAWTFAASARRSGAGYETGALRVECTWIPGVDVAACECTVECAASRDRVALPGPATVSVRRDRDWTHVDVRTPDAMVASASFERGRLAYCRSDVPGIAGIAGGTHDPPTGILELYEHAAR
jgi:hypothetical protein